MTNFLLLLLLRLSATKNMKKYHTQDTEDFTHIRTWLLCSFIKGLTRDKWNSLGQPMRLNQNQNLSQSTPARGAACRGLEQLLVLPACRK